MISVGVWLLARGASAQPLADFLSTAARSAEVRESEAVVRQRDAERTQALGRLLPAASARAGYTRNQYEVAVTLPASAGANITRAVITPLDQLEATVSLEVPLLDLGAWSRLRAAGATADGARHRATLSLDDARRRIARQWFTWVASAALRAEAVRALDAADRSVTRTRHRLDAGVGSPLDVLRAEADAARARQDVADATRALETAAHTLRGLTGVAPTSPPPLAEDDLRDPGALDRWEAGALETPGVRAALADARVSVAQARAAWLTLAPTVSASAAQRWTNAAGFGPTESWSAGVALAWRLDVGTFAAARASDAAGDAARARAEAVVRDARDDVFSAWTQVRSGLARAEASRAQVRAADAAASTARERLASGTGTELDALLAARDAFSAAVSRVQADADLGYARVLLRLAAARPLDAEGGP